MTLTIAVLGCGSIGRRHLQNVRMLGYTGMIAYDPEPEALEQIGAEQGVLAVDDLQLVWARQPSVVLEPRSISSPCARARSAGSIRLARGLLSRSNIEGLAKSGANPCTVPKE